MHPHQRSPRSLPPAALPKPTALGLGRVGLHRKLLLVPGAAMGHCHASPVQLANFPAPTGPACPTPSLGKSPGRPSGHSAQHTESHFKPRAEFSLAASPAREGGASPDAPLVKSNTHIKESASPWSAKPHPSPEPPVLLPRWLHPWPFARAVRSARHALPPDRHLLASPCPSDLSLPMCLPQGAVPEHPPLLKYRNSLPSLTPGVHHYLTPS